MRRIEGRAINLTGVRSVNQYVHTVSRLADAWTRAASPFCGGMREAICNCAPADRPRRALLRAGLVLGVPTSSQPPDAEAHGPKGDGIDVVEEDCGGGVGDPGLSEGGQRALHGHWQSLIRCLPHVTLSNIAEQCRPSPR